LCDVRDLVGEHSGKLALVVACEDQSRIDSDESARHREGVDALVADHEKPEAVITVIRAARDLRTERFDVLGKERIVDDDAGIAQLQHDAAAELTFPALVQYRVSGTAEIG